MQSDYEERIRRLEEALTRLRYDLAVAQYQLAQAAQTLPLVRAAVTS